MAEQLLISDLHLAAERPATLALFLRFLAERARGADTLYILGDLFDAWIGDDDDSDLASRVRDGLRALSDTGTHIYIQHGNRDFLIGEGFLNACGARLLDETAVVDLAGEPTLLMHGDLLCSDDTDYQQARLLVRSPAFINDFLARPLAERAALAAEYRRKSGEATSLKAEDIMDVNPGTVADYLRRHRVTRLIHGHTHRPGEHSHALDGLSATRLVLSEWHRDRGETLCVNASGIHRETIT